MAHSPRFTGLCQQAKTRVTETDCDTVHQRISNQESFLLIDVREDCEWSQGRIPGATHLGKGIIERDIEKLCPEVSTEIVLYCGGGYRSLLAADALQKMGYTSVVSMAGGYRDWIAAKFPIVT